MTQSSKRDVHIHAEVLQELRLDARVDETDVGVEVDGGVVTLTGTVTSWAKRLAAEEAAHRVVGVRDVANDIAVKVPGVRTDTEIAQAVRHALEWDVFVPAETITSTVTDGQVTLAGTVERASQRADAERAIRNLMGVARVINRIAVEPPAPMTQEVRRAIEDVLERRAGREARRIHVDVHGGTVTLSGTVHCRAEQKSVVAAARFSPGVHTVEDCLVTDVGESSGDVRLELE
ncbi:MAG: BON domain-containing protein [Candidatus Rokubacteria bacterium]|nr:BON domain-containing protein [Candidatus Rokubacteria bacterium]